MKHIRILSIKIIKGVLFFLLHFFWIFPVKRNRIFFESYNGKQYSCNPKYIFESIDKEKYECVWAYYDKKESGPENAKIVKRKGFAYFYYLLTSKIAITNINFSSYIPFKKKQVLIDTWHGGGGYKYGIFGGTKKETKKAFSKFTFFVSSCDVFTKEVIQNTFSFEGSVLEIGMPRNDILFSSEGTSKSIFDKYCNSSDKIFVLYAPTYRDFKTTKGEYEEIDFKKIGESLQHRFGKEVIWVIRAHHFDSNHVTNEKNLIDGRLFSDMQVLLKACDILITDYSSSIWDFSITKKPCFLFASDLEKYESVRSFYRPIEEWGFPFATTNSSLSKIIEEFETDSYSVRIDSMHSKWGSFEKGNATEKINCLIKKIIYGE